jgi:hypothetical protein
LNASCYFRPCLGALLVLISGHLGFRLFISEDQRLFLPGQTTHGHYQIELACRACHTPFKGVSNAACLRCHQEELKSANDSHAPAKFSDPRNADGLARLDARQCVTCHVEHRPAITRQGDVTQPDDHCFHCHASVIRDRPSHRDFDRHGCATAGCHNYHDNRSLYEDFLVKHRGRADTAPEPLVPQRNLRMQSGDFRAAQPLSAADHDAPSSTQFDPSLIGDWAATAHAGAGVNCTDCHVVQLPGQAREWSDQPGLQGCVHCHTDEVNGFLAGRHGMRLAQQFPPMSPALARLPMKRGEDHAQLTCVSCHGAHRFDARQAAVESCLGCHSDEHSLAYKESPHFRLWEAEVSGGAPPGSGVSCATCHLPREPWAESGRSGIRVRHNQNANLRPNTAMLRDVCLSCHGLELSMAALLDPALLRNNFRGKPAPNVESLRMVEQRLLEGETSSQTPKQIGEL